MSNEKSWILFIPSNKHPLNPDVFIDIEYLSKRSIEQMVKLCHLFNSAVTEWSGQVTETEWHSFIIQLDLSNLSVTFKLPEWLSFIPWRISWDLKHKYSDTFSLMTLTNTINYITF